MEKRAYLSNLRPVGEFVTDFEKRAISVQPNMIRRLNDSLIRDGGHEINLHYGLDQFVERGEFKNKIFPMLLFLKISESTYGEHATSEAGEVVCTRTVLVQIASSAYSSDQCDDNRFDDGFLIVLFKRNDRYYVCEYNTPSKSAKTGGQNPSMYGGIKFEDYMTLGENQKQPDLDSVASSALSYHAVFKTNLVDNAKKTTHKLFYPAKVDCIDKNGKYTEIKFRKQPLGFGRSWWRIEMTWYLQALFEDNKRIIVGISDGADGVNKVKEIKPESLESSKNEQWNSEGCLEYLSKFLTDAKQKLDETPDNTYYCAVRQPNQTGYVITTYNP